MSSNCKNQNTESGMVIHHIAPKFSSLEEKMRKQLEVAHRLYRIYKNIITDK